MQNDKIHDVQRYKVNKNKLVEQSCPCSNQNYET